MAVVGLSAARLVSRTGVGHALGCQRLVRLVPEPDAPPLSRGLPVEIRIAAVALAAILATLWVLRIVRMF